MCSGIPIVLVGIQIAKSDCAVTIKHALQSALCMLSIVVEYFLPRGATGWIGLGHIQALERVLDSLKVISDAVEALSSTVLRPNNRVDTLDNVCRHGWSWERALRAQRD